MFFRKFKTFNIDKTLRKSIRYVNKKGSVMIFTLGLLLLLPYMFSQAWDITRVLQSKVYVKQLASTMAYSIVNNNTMGYYYQPEYAQTDVAGNKISDPQRMRSQILGNKDLLQQYLGLTADEAEKMTPENIAKTTFRYNVIANKMPTEDYSETGDISKSHFYFANIPEFDNKPYILNEYIKQDGYESIYDRFLVDAYARNLPGYDPNNMSESQKKELDEARNAIIEKDMQDDPDKGYIKGSALVIDLDKTKENTDINTTDKDGNTINAIPQRVVPTGKVSVTLEAQIKYFIPAGFGYVKDKKTNYDNDNGLIFANEGDISIRETAVAISIPTVYWKKITKGETAGTWKQFPIDWFN